MALEFQKNLLPFGGYRAAVAISKGMGVKFHATAGYVTISAIANDPGIIGVATEDAAIDDYVAICSSGLAQVKVNGAIAVNTCITTAVTTGLGVAATAGQNSFAKLWEASGASGDLVTAFINPHGRG